MSALTPFQGSAHCRSTVSVSPFFDPDPEGRCLRRRRGRSRGSGRSEAVAASSAGGQPAASRNAGVSQEAISLLLNFPLPSGSSSKRLSLPAAVEVGDPFADDFVDRDGDRAVLEERLFEVADVVDDHGGAGGGQAADVFGEGDSPRNAVAKEIVAPGARSWTICAMRPALVGGFGGEEVVEDADRRGEAAGVAGCPAGRRWRRLPPRGSARSASVSKESERMPTVTPPPSTPKSARASAAASWVSPSEFTEPQVP